ncbi:hypothetical protein BDQ17DRAFT_1328734 [Cyathus striatus]|nr:hypothetical protein BDQ17DRAFT_1328734 [Cyathus striatus]
MSSNAKTAEFVRLFELFEHLSNRGSRSTKGGPSSKLQGDVQNVPIPEDLAPIIKNLATIVGTRKAETPRVSGGRPRRNTVAGSLLPSDSIDSDSEDDAESLAKFPVNKQFPFTFKMMLHKLYHLEDWGRTVKEFLEKSQMEFKPLAEQDMALNGEKGVEVTTNVKPATRVRSHSTAGIRIFNHIEDSKPTSAERCEEFRALKKRCVGRRKSFSGPMITEDGPAESSWVYDAAVSALEIPQRQPVVKFVESGPESPKTVAIARSRYQFLGEGQLHRPIIAKRRMSAEAPPSTIPQPTPFQVVTNQNRKGTRKRAMTVVDTTTPATTDNVFRRNMKRPFTF